MSDILHSLLILSPHANSVECQILPFIADMTGPLPILLLSSSGSAILAFGWIGVNSTPGVVVFCILYGLFSGAFITLTLTVIAVEFCPDLGKLGVRMGMMCLPTSIGILMGNPIVGAILRRCWIGLQLFCGLNATVASMILASVWYLKKAC